MRYALLLLLLLPSASALQWSEIMFDPAGNDNGREFIELLGNESLDGCTVRDTASSDRLALNRSGNDIILIVESGYLIDTAGATVYTAGNAIGNGLGNTFERIELTCDGTDINISTSYNASTLDVPTGASIVFYGTWKAGSVNGTPGAVAPIAQALETPRAPEADVQTESPPPCNNTLLVTAPAAAIEGELVSFNITAAGYAYYEIISDGELIDVGDTLSDDHSFVARGKTRIVAHAEYCDGSQRSARTVTAAPRNVTQEVHEELSVTIPPQEETPPPQAPQVTAVVIMDDDRDALPWITAFGMVTIITSAIIFLQLLRREDGHSSSQDEGKVYKDGLGTSGHEGKPDQGTSLKGLDPGDRHV